MKKLMVIPLVAAGMAAMVGCSKTPVKEAAKNDAINLANLTRLWLRGPISISMLVVAG